MTEINYFGIKIPIPIELPFLKKKETKSEEYEKYENKLIEYLTSPSTIVKHPNEIQMEKYHRIIASVNYPRLVEPGWLTRIIEMNIDFDLSMHISPYSIESSISMLENEIKKQKTDIYGSEAEGKIVPQSLIQKHQDTLALLNLIQQGTEKMFYISLYIDAKEFDIKELEKISSRIKSTMNSLMITPKVPSYQMYKGIRSVLPIANDELGVTRNITSSAIAACFPFATTSLEHHATGILIGFNQINNIPIIIDPFELTNPNILVLGTSGGGKSFSIKLILMREFLEGVDINIIDPQAEYNDLIKTFGGRTIRIAPDSDTIINPFDLMDQTLDEKKLSLISFFKVLLGEMTEGERAILDDAIDRTYEDKGITKDPKTWSKKPPIIEDLYSHIVPLTRSEKELIYEPAMAIINRLRAYVSGTLRFLNQHTRISLDNKMISFDIRDIPDVGKGPLMFLILEYVYTQMKKSKNRKILVIDEAWTVLSAGEEGEYVFRIVKTCRKFNLSLIMITQDVEDILTSKAGRAVISNTATKLLLKQDATVVARIAEIFHLNETDVHFLKTAVKGNCLLLAENLKVPVYIQASPEEHRIITTRPDELIEMVHEMQGPEVERILKPEFEITKPIHLKSELTIDQIRVLEGMEFLEIRVETLDGRDELFLIKNETNDSDEHFVLQYLIFDEIKKYGERVLIHHTKLPDITLETPEGRIIAIEVIGDASMKDNISKMEEKLNILKKYNEYLFVVTDPKLKKYESFGEILTRTDVPMKIKSYFETDEIAVSDTEETSANV